jgi:hypothetical protein
LNIYTVWALQTSMRWSVGEVGIVLLSVAQVVVLLIPQQNRLISESERSGGENQDGIPS